MLLMTRFLRSPNEPVDYCALNCPSAALLFRDTIDGGERRKRAMVCGRPAAAARDGREAER